MNSEQIELLLAELEGQPRGANPLSLLNASPDSGH
jgi:hypothetical protein